MNKEYVDKLYGFAKEELGDGFTKTREEFETALSDTAYVDKLYNFAQETLGEGFDKSKVDFYSLVATKKPTQKSPEEIKARGEEAYKQMMGDIDTEYDKAYVEDNYGWIKNKPVANFGMSLIAPSSMESIDAGEIPSVGDIGIDVGLAAAGLAGTPERIALTTGRYLPRLGRFLAPSASRLKNIAVGALEQGAIAGAGEGALSTQHDRDYSLTAPIVGGVGGGILGGTATTSMARKLVDGGFDKAEIPDVMRKLGITEKGTLDAIGKGGAIGLDQIGVQNVDIPVYTDDVLEPKKYLEKYKAFKSVDADMALKPVHENMDKVDRLQNISLKAKEKSLAELRELEDTFHNKLIKADDQSRKSADDLFAGGSTPILEGSDINADDLYKMMVQPHTRIPLAGYLKDVEETITNSNLRRSIITDITKASGEEKALKGLLDRGKYESIIEKTPDVIESGTILGTAKNVVESAPHNIKTARDVLKAPVTVAERAKERKEKPKKEESKYTNRSGYSSDGNLLYAPRGYITYDDLWKEAEGIKKKLPSLEIR